MTDIEGWEKQSDYSFTKEGDVIDFDGLVFEVGASDSNHYVTVPFSVIRELLKDVGYEVYLKDL